MTMMFPSQRFKFLYIHNIRQRSSIGVMAGRTLALQSQNLCNPNSAQRHPLRYSARFIFATQLRRNIPTRWLPVHTVFLLLCVYLVIPQSDDTNFPIDNLTCVNSIATFLVFIDLCLTQKHNQERSLFSYFEKALRSARFLLEIGFQRLYSISKC